MTQMQEYIINKAKEKINEIRNMLDDVMYRTSPDLPEEDFQKVREAYNRICEANDKLP